MPPIVPVPRDHPESSSEDDLSCSNVDPDLQMDEFDSNNSNTGNPVHEGYELLSQEADNCTNGAEHGALAEDSDPESEQDISLAVQEESPPFFVALAAAAEFMHGIETNEVKPIIEKESQMDQDHIDKIKDVMKGIVLPSSNLPHWASVVPEEEWKAQLISGLNTKVNNKNNKTVSRGDDKDLAEFPSTSEVDKDNIECKENKPSV